MSAHDGLHLVGCFALCLAFACFRWPRWKVVSIVMGLGIIWECLDQLNYWFAWNLSFLDIRGFDLKDICYDLLGIALACLFSHLVVWWENRNILLNGRNYVKEN